MYWDCRTQCFTSRQRSAVQARDRDPIASRMPVTTRTTGDGRTIRLMESGGFALPEQLFGPSIPGRDLDGHMKDIRDMEMREDDILICTFVKSGTHWICEIVSMVIKGVAEYEKNPKENMMVEFQTIDSLSAIPSPRVLNTHLPCWSLPSGTVGKRCKMIHIERNPKDIAVSLYHHMKNESVGITDLEDAYETFDKFLPHFTGDFGFHLFYPWFKYLSEFDDFTKNHPDLILNLRYEDMKRDPVGTVHKVAQFLGVVCHDDLASDIADKCQFQKLRQADIDVKDRISLNNQQLGKLTSTIYRKGEVGDWKNWFTVAQNERFDRWLEASRT